MSYNTVVFDGEMGIVTQVTQGDLPYYTGATEVTPSDQTQTLQTADTVVTSNITINPIPDMELETVDVTYTPTESEQTATITASSGYDAIEQVNVTVEAIDSEYVGSDVPRKDSTDLTASGATVTAPAGYYAENASASVASGTEGTPTATKGTVSSHSVSVTPSVTNAAGYISGGTHTGTAVTVSASELVSGNKSITANGTDIDVTDYATVSVAVPGDAPTLETKSVSYTPTESQQTAQITASTGYDGLEEVDITVGAISSTYVGSGITRRSSTDLSASGATVSVPAGYYENEVSKAVTSGSATTPATAITANPTISVNSSTGVITATASASQSVTPTVSAGYVSSGTAGTVTVSGSATETLSTQAAQTITPTTTAQTIAAGKYLTGAQTVEGIVCENLTAANIVSGVTVKVGTATDDDSVASVTGTASGGTDTIAQRIENELTSYEYTGTAVLPGGLFTKCTSLVSASFPNVTVVGNTSGAHGNDSRQFAGCTNLETVSFPELTTVSGQSTFEGCTKLSTLIVPKLVTINAAYFLASCGSNKTFVFPSIVTLGTDAFRSTNCTVDLGSGLTSLPARVFYSATYSTVIFRNATQVVVATADNSIAGINQSTTIYIPKALYDHLGDNSSLDYRAATNWAAKTTTTFACIEGSQYENYYADGTPIPTT